MKHEIVAIRDCKGECFGRPFFSPTLGMAIRSFDDEVNRNAPDNILHHHSGDFALFHLGQFEDTDGSFTPVLPKLLMQGDQVKKKIVAGSNSVDHTVDLAQCKDW